MKKVHGLVVQILGYEPLLGPIPLPTASGANPRGVRRSGGVLVGGKPPRRARAKR